MNLSPNLLSSLQKLRLFQDLSPTQIKRVFATCKQETFEPGAILAKSGADSDRMFIAMSGAVDIRSARDLLLAREKAVTTIGETGLLSGEVRSATVVVTEAVNALVGRRPLMQVMQDDATLAIRLYRNAMALVRGKLIAADQRIERMMQGEEEPE
jgi:CRP-like cAMP-binding protein